ncbi:hypothetical protein [Bacillus sp. Marseille-P3661]|nr:hypothetical protein [Bacillus sp. Marseille-P3661]
MKVTKSRIAAKRSRQSENEVVKVTKEVNRARQERKPSRGGNE